MRAGSATTPAIDLGHIEKCLILRLAHELQKVYALMVASLPSDSDAPSAIFWANIFELVARRPPCSLRTQNAVVARRLALGVEAHGDRTLANGVFSDVGGVAPQHGTARLSQLPHVGDPRPLHEAVEDRRRGDDEDERGVLRCDVDLVAGRLTPPCPTEAGKMFGGLRRRCDDGDFHARLRWRQSAGVARDGACGRSEPGLR